MRRHLDWMLPVLIGFAWIGIWYGAIVIGNQPPYILPPIHGILQAAFEERDMLIPAALRTGFSAVLGFVAAVGGGGIMAMILAPYQNPLTLPYTKFGNTSL